MSREVARRTTLVGAVFMCQGFVVHRAMQWELGLVSEMVFKAAPVMLLAFIALGAEEQQGNEPSRRAKLYANRVGVGLALSSFGDAALEAENGFLVGLGFFLLAHVLYCAAFQMDTSNGVRRRRGPSYLLMARFAMLFWSTCVAGIYTFLAGHLPENMKMPVALYVATIGFMVYRAVGRYDPSCGTESHTYSSAGAILFAMSDLMLAYNRFVENLSSARFMVMFLYYSGQVSLCTSTIFPMPSPNLLKPVIAAPPPSSSTSPALKSKSKSTTTTNNKKSKKKRN